MAKKPLPDGRTLPPPSQIRNAKCSGLKGKESITHNPYLYKVLFNLGKSNTFCKKIYTQAYKLLLNLFDI